jgi:excinuclease ABC subunit A
MAIHDFISVRGANEHNLKNIDIDIKRGALTVVTGVSGSGKSSLAFDTVLAESQRRFFYTLSHYSRQFLDLGTRPAVRKISGLSPAIALAQNETAPSRRSTLGSLTDISELLAVMFARFGQQLCPKHRKPTSAMTKEEVVRHLIEAADGKTVALVVALAESKKGIFRKELTQYAAKGYTKAWIDGSVVELDTIPVLVRDEKHTIKILIDLLKVKGESPERLTRGVQTVLDLSGGYGEWFFVDTATKNKNAWDVANKHVFSTKSGCPECGFAWPRLDSRYFNSNSLGRCEDCDGYGAVDVDEEAEDDADGQAALLDDVTCESCAGTGVQKDAEAIILERHTIQELLNLPLTSLARIFEEFGHTKTNPAFTRVHTEISSSIDRLLEMKLGYLSLSRRVRSLSGGEAQRVKLSGILSTSLRGILYVLDEPSQGLHHTEMATMIVHLKALRDQGNTILVVDHDEDIMRAADYIVDLGPTGGRDGGYILASFPPSEASRWVKESKTAESLTRTRTIPKRRHIDRIAHDFMVFSKPRINNLKMDQIKIPLEAMTVVTGVSGAGKSSLVLGVILPNLLASMADTTAKTVSWKNCANFSGHQKIQRVELIDRRPVAKSSISMPATYLDVLGELRDLYAQLPDAQVAGLTAKSFSMHLEGGRCPECKGRGQINLTMRFLADARVQCSVCLGRRFRPHVLDIKYNGLSIYDVLNLSVDEAVAQFSSHRRIVVKLAPAQRLGLGYLKLGQPSASLSGGEAQRLKMVPYFTKKMGLGCVLILDEPTTGLHFEDVQLLTAVMRELTDLGVTLIVVEHNEDVISAADWNLTIGPQSAELGGELVYEGVPKVRES